MATKDDSFLSSVFLGEVVSSDLGYTVEEVTVTWAAGMVPGALLEVSSGKYIWAVPANGANVKAVLADARALPEFNGQFTAGSDYTLKVKVRGTTVNRNKLLFTTTATSGQLDAAQAALEAKGFKVTDKYTA